MSRKDELLETMSKSIQEVNKLKDELNALELEEMQKTKVYFGRQIFSRIK